MSASKTKDWMKRHRLRSVSVYFHEKVFERLEAAAKQDQRSKANWIHKIVMQALQKGIDH